MKSHEGGHAKKRRFSPSSLLLALPCSQHLGWEAASSLPLVLAGLPHPCPTASPLAEARTLCASRAGAADHQGTVGLSRLSSGHWLALVCLHLCYDRRRAKSKLPNPLCGQSQGPGSPKGRGMRSSPQAKLCSPDLGESHPSSPSWQRRGAQGSLQREGRNARAKCSVLGNGLALELKPT